MAVIVIPPPLTRSVAHIDDYGARGNGVTNDTAALLAAAATGLPVLVGQKAYLIYADAKIDYDFTVIGVHRQNSILRWGNTTGAVSLFRFGGAALNASFSNLTMDANRQAHTDNLSYFAMVDFRADDGSRLDLDGVDFINGRINDIIVEGPTTTGEMIYANIRDCWFYDGLVGTSTARAAAITSIRNNVDVNISSNRASLPTMPSTYGRAGFIMQRPNSSPLTSYGRFTAIGNRFKNIGCGTANTLGCLDVYSGAQITVIDDNTGENIPGRFICVKGDQDTISVTGNLAKNVFSSDPNTATAFVMFPDPLDDGEKDRDITFTGNIVRGCSGYGFMFDGANHLGDVDYRNVLYSGNIADDCELGGYLIRNVENLVISSPMVDGCRNGFIFSGCSGLIKIEGGSIADIEVYGIAMIDFSGLLTDMDFVVRGTTFQNCALRSISLLEVKSYDLDVDIDTSALGIHTEGSTGLSRIKARMRDVTTPWAKGGTDALLMTPQIDSDVVLSFTSIYERTIAAGVISVFMDRHYVDTEADAASDDLDTITAGYDGQRVTLFAASNTRDVVLKDGTGNLALAGDVTLNYTHDAITLIYSAINLVWIALGPNDNHA